MDLSRYIVVIPARSGSKRLPGKNYLDFCGKPLWRWAADCAEEVGFDRRMIYLAIDNGVPKEVGDGIAQRYSCYVRPDELVSDDAPVWWTVEAIMYDRCKFLDVVLLQPTSPLRTAGQVVQVMREHRAGAVTASVSPHAGRSFGVGGCPASELNGGVFVASWKDWTCDYRYRHRVFCDTGPDINDSADWHLAEALMRKRSRLTI